jgi:hypothetical protein
MLLGKGFEGFVADQAAALSVVGATLPQCNIHRQHPQFRPNGSINARTDRGQTPKHRCSTQSFFAGASASVGRVITGSAILLVLRKPTINYPPPPGNVPTVQTW